MKFVQYKMEDVLEYIIDYRGKTPNKSDNGILTLSAKSVRDGYIDYSQCYCISKEEYKKFMVRGFPHIGDVLLTTEAPLGVTARVDRDDVALAQRLLTLRGKRDLLDTGYLYYYLRSPIGQGKLKERQTGTTVSGIKQAEFRKIEIVLPNIEMQRKIASILESIDNKIELNKRINENLEKQAQAIYNKMFIATYNEQRKICRAEEYFDISIGKTPPRNEHQWFTTNSNDVPWISISDMGKNEIYISRSSENLTKEAIDKFNIKIIPNNTVILSFKLTIGRVLITNGKMTSNEAIAHFKTDKNFINEYLYFYLKKFKYQTMGNTSSIATAINSKIIKSMPFVIPTDNEINNFHLIVKPMFEQILNNQLQNKRLATLRDTLLPKLMSGELDVSALKYKI